MSRYRAAFLLLSVTACEGASPIAPSLQRERRAAPRVLPAAAQWPDAPEVATVGAIDRRVERRTGAFGRLVQSEHPRVIFKDEERTGADRLMTPRLREKLHALAGLVQKEWPALELRVTEAWDENGEHGKNSLHYEGRAVDLTTSDLDQQKLGRLAGLAIQAGFDWVYRESTHVHASVSR